MIRLPNAPYLKVDVAGRLVVNAYRTGQHRHDGLNPIVQKVDERGRFDTMRGLFIHVGRVGIMLAIKGNGPARKPNKPPASPGESGAA